MDGELIAQASALRDKYEAQMEKFQMQNGLDETFRVISRANKYIDETAPWVLAKDEAKKPRLARVMYNLLETLRICGTLLVPFIPDSCAKIFDQIGASTGMTDWDGAAKWGVMWRRSFRSWTRCRRPPEGPPSPPLSWSPSSRKRWTLKPSASPISGP